MQQVTKPSEGGKGGHRKGREQKKEKSKKKRGEQGVVGSNWRTSPTILKRQREGWGGIVEEANSLEVGKLGVVSCEGLTTGKGKSRLNLRRAQLRETRRE